MGGAIVFGWRDNLLSKNLSGVLDHARWVAALAVCAHHLRNLLFPDADTVAHISLPAKIFYFITLFGPQAVYIFFAISGLLVGGTVLKKIKEGRFDALNYAIDRASRLYIVLIPAVVLSVALYMSGMSTACRGGMNISGLFSNLIFLQNIATEPLCNNHPLWSLANEAFYYVAFPAAALMIMRRSLWAVTVFILMAVIAAWSTSNYNSDAGGVAFGAIIWCAGLVPWFVSVKTRIPIGLLLLLCALIASRMHIINNDYIAGLAISVSFALALCQPQPAPISNETFKIGERLAAFSYSLYLVHSKRSPDPT